MTATRGDVTATSDTGERILEGALRALARHGPEKMSVSDICDETGIARATFYRYFTNREDVLEALGRHYENGVSAALTRAVLARPEQEHRLEVVLEAIMSYREGNRAVADLTNTEPGFALRFLREVFPNLAAIFTAAVEPALASSDAVRAGVLGTDQAGELLFRIAVSQLLLPSSHAAELPRLIVALWETQRDAG